MASVFLFDRRDPGGPGIEIDYSIVDGRVREFSDGGVPLYDERKGIETAGWLLRLVSVIRKAGLDRPSKRGLHMFVYRLMDEGLLL